MKTQPRPRRLDETISRAPLTPAGPFTSVTMMIRSQRTIIPSSD